jgi:transposase InsO family protein
MQDRGLENTWLMDFGCSHHMTESSKWFSSLDPMIGKEYITFGDNSRRKVVSRGTIRVKESFILKDVALVSNLHFNLLLVSQLLEDDYEVRFKKGLSRVLDAHGDLICQFSPFGRVFSANFSHSSGPSRCLLVGSSSSLWKWHRRLGHLSFDLLCRLSSLDLIQGLPKLKFEKDLVCQPCRHGKMTVASHSSVTKVMTSHPCELLHMDIVGPVRVFSFGGKWFVLVVVDDFSRYSWVFFMVAKDEAFTHARDLILRLQNELPKNAMRAIRGDNGTEFKNTQFATFCASLGLEHQFSSPYVPQQDGIVERKNRTLVEMAKTILDEHRTPRHFWSLLAMCPIASFFGLF